MRPPREIWVTAMFASFKNNGLGLIAGLAGSLAVMASPLHAQGMETIDPDSAYAGGIDADLAPPPADSSDSAELPAKAPAETYAEPAEEPGQVNQWPEFPESQAPQPAADAAPAAVASTETTAAGTETTYGEDDLIGAAEGVFGKGAEGLARMIEKMLKDQGQPNAYIVGREAGAALGVGLRYGSGTMHHKVEGERKVYWTGPSIGFDAGANAANTFVLVYNLYDSEELYSRYPAGEGQAYVVGGLTASYLRKGDVVLIPIRMGAGLRLGINAGYMKFSKKQRWLPF